MNKKLKNIVSMTIVITGLSAVALPVSSLNPLITAAYASSSDADDLDSLTVETSAGKELQLYKSSSYSTKVDDDDVESGKTYYVKTSSSKVSVNIDGPDEDYVRIFKGSSSKAYEPGDDISVSSGTTLKVRVFEDSYEDYYDDDDEEYDYSSSDYKEYKIVVKDTSSSSSDDDDDDDDNDDIYLSNIYLSQGDIDFDEDTTSYNVNVDSDVDSVKITAEPEDDDYTVKINGSTVDEDDDYERRVSLGTGDNTVKIKISDDDDNTRTYTLNINRASDDSDDTSTQSTSTSSTTSEADTSNEVTVKPITNQWINNGGVWKYNDALGAPLTNTWFYDRNYGKTYYLQGDGSMKTGWLNKDNGWYYLDESGAKQTGWKSLNGSWYYLDSDGKMQTGWFKDNDSSWYYLQASGVMAANTTISGYKLGSNGALIK